MAGPFDRSGINRAGSSEVVPQQYATTSGTSTGPLLFPDGTTQYTSGSTSGTSTGFDPAIIDSNGTPILATNVSAQSILTLLGVTQDEVTAQDLIDLINADGDVQATLDGSTVQLTFTGPIQDSELASTFVKTVDGNVPNASGNVISSIILQNESGAQLSSGVQALRFTGDAVSPTLEGTTAIIDIVQPNVDNKADTATTVVDTDIIMNGAGEITSIVVGSTAHVFANIEGNFSFDTAGGGSDDVIAVVFSVSGANVVTGTVNVAHKANLNEVVSDADVLTDDSGEVNRLVVGGGTLNIAQPDISGKADISDVVLDSDVTINGAGRISQINVGGTQRDFAVAEAVSSLTGDSGTADDISTIHFQGAGSATPSINVTENPDGTATVSVTVDKQDITSETIIDHRNGSVTNNITNWQINADGTLTVHFGSNLFFEIPTVADIEVVPGGILKVSRENTPFGTGVDILEEIFNGLTVPPNLAIPLLDTDIASKAYVDSVSEEGGGGASVTISPTPPALPEEGDIWLDRDDGVESTWDGAQWVQTGGPGVVITPVEDPNQMDVLTLTNGWSIRAATEGLVVLNGGNAQMLLSAAGVVQFAGDAIGTATLTYTVPSDSAATFTLTEGWQIVSATEGLTLVNNGTAQAQLTTSGNFSATMAVGANFGTINYTLP